MKKDYYASMKKYKYPFYILRHPVDGYQEMKNNNKYSFPISNLILGLWVLLTILNWGYIDYDFRYIYSDVDLLYVLLSTLVIFTMVIVANWCFCTLMDGKGRFSEIWICISYSLLPYLICGYVRFILSYFLVMEEAVFLDYLMTISYLWTFMLFMIGLSVLHDYSVAKTIGSLMLTILGVLIIVFFMILISGLVIQIYGFFVTVFSELSYRLR